MHVLHVYRTYFPETQGGLEEVIRQICLNARPLGVQSRVLSLANDATQRIVERDEANVYRSRRNLEVASCGMSLQAFRVHHHLLEWADVVHYHFPWPFADLLHLTARIRRPSVVTYHSDIVRQRLLGKLYAPLMNRFLRSVDRIVCTSPNYFATSDVLTRFEHKVEIVPIGINEDSYPAPSQATIDQARAEFGEGFFLFVGVLRYYKGLHILLDALQGAPFRVLIVGAGPIEEELKRQAHRLGLTNVTFTGWLPDEMKMALFRLSRAVVFPSYLRAEAFGVTLLEGAMSARPLISTEVGSGTSHVNVDGETGCVVAPGSAKALRQAMDRLYFRPREAELMGGRARERYEQLFTGRLMGQRYVRVYRALTNLEAAPLPLAAGADD